MLISNIIALTFSKCLVMLFFNEAIMYCVHHIKFKAYIINTVFYLELFNIK